MDWNHWRKEFPITERVTHFNHAGVSPVSRRVVEAVGKFGSEALVVDRALQQGWEERTEKARAAFATLVGAHSDEVAFVKNTSEGLSLVAAGLDWRAGDNVIAVDNEYPSNIYPWFGLRRWGVETRLVRTRRGRVHVDDVAALADQRTRLLSVSFVDWNSGARTDLRPLAEHCRERGMFFCVDGIQGVGAIQLDVEASGIDFLAVGGHKWLLAHEGCGCLFVSRRVNPQLHSVLHGWKSVTDADTYLPYHFNPRPDAAKLEPGSPSHLAAHALGAALDLLLEIGPAQVEERIMEITDRLATGLRTNGAEVLSPWERGWRSGIVVFRRGDDPQGLCFKLNQRGFVVRVRGGGIRVAPHFYNNEEDIDRLVVALGEV
ncbi:MAG: aminotransferase class V-fold PLP-dependent enzyme [Deltaproteobacteria bacterium]|nr:aminotransferase class V-fold PLP-dependent enzyme [Deltaproteobacteria bacterium]